MSGTLQKAFRSSLKLRVWTVILIPALLYAGVSFYFRLHSKHIAGRAHAALIQRQAKVARSSLGLLLWFHPHDPHANLVLGKIELAEGGTENALECFRKVSPEHDLHRLASFQLAKTFALDGQLTAAEAELERYIQRYKPAEAFWDLYFRLLYLQTRTRDVITLFERKFAVTTNNSPSDIKFLLQAEFVPQESGETLAALEEIYRKHPDDVNAQVARAIALNRTGNTATSVQLLQDALERQPNHHRARIVLAQWLVNQHDLLRAEEVLWQSGDHPNLTGVEAITQDDRFWGLSSRLVEQQEKSELALQYIDRALKIKAYDKGYLSQRSQILRRLSKRIEATAAAEKSIEVGRIEQDLYLLARDLESRPVQMADCKQAALLYHNLGRPERAELWERLAGQVGRPRSIHPELEGTQIQ